MAWKTQARCQKWQNISQWYFQVPSREWREEPRSSFTPMGGKGQGKPKWRLRKRGTSSPNSTPTQPRFSNQEKVDSCQLERSWEAARALCLRAEVQLAGGQALLREREGSAGRVSGLSPPTGWRSGLTLLPPQESSHLGHAGEQTDCVYGYCVKDAAAPWFFEPLLPREDCFLIILDVTDDFVFVCQRLNLLNAPLDDA